MSQFESTLPGVLPLEVRRSAFVCGIDIADSVGRAVSPTAYALALIANLQTVADEMNVDPMDLAEECLNAIEDDRATVTMAEVGDLVPAGFVSFLLND